MSLKQHYYCSSSKTLSFMLNTFLFVVMLVGPPQSLSAVMPKSHEHHFTSQLDIILAVSKKVAEARLFGIFFIMQSDYYSLIICFLYHRNLTHDPLTPLRKNKRYQRLKYRPLYKCTRCHNSGFVYSVILSIISRSLSLSKTG